MRVGQSGGGRGASSLELHVTCVNSEVQVCPGRSHCRRHTKHPKQCALLMRPSPAGRSGTQVLANAEKYSSCQTLQKTAPAKVKPVISVDSILPRSLCNSEKLSLFCWLENLRERQYGWGGHSKHTEHFLKSPFFRPPLLKQGKGICGEENGCHRSKCSTSAGPPAPTPRQSVVTLSESTRFAHLCQQRVWEG